MPSKSTHPSSSASPVVEDMPMSWPLPTSTQSKVSVTQATAAANQEIQARTAGTLGEPMAQHDVERVKGVLQGLLDLSSQDGNVRKRDDIAKRLDDLYGKLATGAIKTATSQKVMQIATSVEAQDLASAKNLHKEITNTDWETNKNWLVGVQRLIGR